MTTLNIYLTDGIVLPVTLGTKCTINSIPAESFLSRITSRSELKILRVKDKSDKVIFMINFANVLYMEYN